MRRADGRAVPFSDRAASRSCCAGWRSATSWEPIDRGRPHRRAAAARKAAITLEPGGQLELSGELCESVHCAQREFAEHIDQIVTVGDELGIAFLGLGMQPVSRLEEIEWVPKRRYRIMAPYMLRVGTLGQRMMKQTATVQVNIDYASEARRHD